jgi:hypothetical protein
MQRRSALREPVESVLWDLAAVPDEERAWILAQLNAEERQRLAQALESAYTEHPGPTPVNFEATLREMTAVPRAVPVTSALLNEVPDWLAVRLMMSLDTAARREALRAVDWRRRWRLRRAWLRDRYGIRLSATAMAALRSAVQEQAIDNPLGATST